MFIFIDESGDMEAYKGTKFFVIAAIFNYKNNSVHIDQLINRHNKHLWNNGWPKILEIKAHHLYNYKEYIDDISALKINPKIHLQTIYRDINSLDIKIGLLINETAKQGFLLRNLHKEKIYNFLSKQLYHACHNFLENPLHITVDQRNITLVKQQKTVNLSSQRLNLDYIGYITTELSLLFAGQDKRQPRIEISFNDSKKVRGLQIADYVAWACRKKYDGRPHWYDLLGNIEKVEKGDNF